MARHTCKKELKTRLSSKSEWLRALSLEAELERWIECS